MTARHAVTLALAVIAGSLATLAARNVSAEILLDDFSIASSVALPEMQNVWSPVAVVGALSAQRQLRYSANSTATSGHYEAGGDAGPFLYGRVDAVPPSTADTHEVYLQTRYSFNAIDATQAGANAFLFDFESLTMPKASALLRVSFGGPASSRYTAALPLPAIDGPFTFAIPFSDWLWNNPRPDFTTLSSLLVTVKVTPSSAFINDVDFSMRLDQIRIGREVSEPATASLALVALAALAMRRTAAQRQ